MRGMKRGTRLPQDVSIMGRSFSMKQYGIERSDRWAEMRLLEVADPIMLAAPDTRNSLMQSVSQRDP